MDSRIQTDIQQILQELQPDSLLIIDNHNSSECFTENLNNCNVKQINSSDVSKLKTGNQYDVALVLNTLEYLDHTSAGILVSQMRDLYSRRLLILLPINQTNENCSSTWSESDLLAYGMRLITTYENALHLFEYNILNYKSIPDWLNAKNWANPELWDKNRW